MHPEEGSVFAEVRQEQRNLSEIDVNTVNYPLPHKIDPYVNEPDQTCSIVSFANDLLMIH